MNFVSSVSGITLKENMSHIFETGDFTDLTFLVGPTLEEIKAHRTILMIRSPVFATKFDERWESDLSKIQPIHISEVPANSFRMFLKYLYTEEFDAEMSVTEMIDVLSLAHMYCVQGLVTSSSDCIQDNIRIKTCVEIFQRTRVYEDLFVSEEAFTFFLNNISKILQDDSFLTLDVQSMKKFLENDDLELDEVSLFKGLIKWSSYESPNLEENMDQVSRASAMPKFVRLVRYPLMEAGSFGQEVVPTKVLTEREIIDMFLYFNKVGPLPENMIAKARAPISQATIRFTVENISQLRETVNSPIKMLRKLPWVIAVAILPRKGKSPKSLSFFLACNKESDCLRWNCKAEASLKLLHQNPGENDQPFIRKISHIFNGRENDWGYSGFIDWHQLINPANDYVKDDSIILEVDIKAEAPYED